MLNKINNENGTVNFFQGLMLFLAWSVAIGMTFLFINLVSVSYQVNDHQTASIAISIIAIVVFWILAGVLTYVFTGLRKGAGKEKQP